MGLRPLERQTLREKVAGVIKAFIVENGLKPGDRLPTEHKLAEQLAIGRSSVREAMKALETIGVVESRPRVGCVVRSVDLSLLARHISFSRQVNGVTMAELLEARELLETYIIPKVIQKGDPAALEEMAEGLRMGEEAVAGTRDLHEAEKQFHAALFRGAHNAVLQGFREVIEGFFDGLQMGSPASGSRKWLEDHRGIYEAVKGRNTVLAQALMRAYLGRYAERVSFIGGPLASAPRRVA